MWTGRLKRLREETKGTHEWDLLNVLRLRKILRERRKRMKLVIMTEKEQHFSFASLHVRAREREREREREIFVWIGKRKIGNEKLLVISGASRGDLIYCYGNIKARSCRDVIFQYNEFPARLYSNTLYCTESFRYTVISALCI